MSNTNITGLRERIAAASTINEVQALLNEGKWHYSRVSLKTARQWQATAARRIKELEAAKPAPGTYVGETGVEVVIKPPPVSNGRAERRRARRAAGQ